MADSNNFMEQEAIRRAGEMQGRGQKNQNVSRTIFGNTAQPPFTTINRRTENTPEQKSQHLPVGGENTSDSRAQSGINNNAQAQQKDLHNQGGNLVDLLMKDKDKSIIMLLILILTSEGADSGLILALMYLMI